MRKYISRFTSSARGELFNPLTYPFLFSTLAYGIGFTAFLHTASTLDSSLYIALVGIGASFPVIWGVAALTIIVSGVTFLLFNIPPIGKLSGLAGFVIWAFAGMCYLLTGAYLPLFAVAIPNMIFWFWQYLSLSKFRREDARDIKTMLRYDRGEYDDELNPKDAKASREDNRGTDVQ